MSRAVATLFGVGLMRPAPGTWGSLAALPLFWVLYALGGVGLTSLATLAVIVGGTWAIRAATAGSADKDPGEIVIDEVAGQWVALFPVAFGAAFASVPVLALWPGWLAAFALFRLFDIWKPWLVGRADRMGTPWGVMLDDVIAGGFAAVSTFALGALWHAVML